MTQPQTAAGSIFGSKLFLLTAFAQIALAAAAVFAQTRFLYPADEQASPAGLYEMASLLVVTALALGVGVAGRGGFAMRLPVLLAGVVFAAIVAHEAIHWSVETDAEDWITLGLWVVASLALVFVSRRRAMPPIATALLSAAALAKLLAIGTDIADEGSFGLTSGEAALSWTHLVATAAAAAAIQLGVLGLAARGDGTFEQRLGLSREHGLGARLAGAIADVRYKAWRRANPDKSYGDYYGERLAARLERGGSHKTLGAVAHWDRLKTARSRDWARAEFETRGAAHREWFFSRGVSPDMSCVDYGCGSLRVGQHFIRHLDSGRWFGLDVVDRFWKDGLTLIDPAVLADKRPSFAVISPEGLAEAAARKPDLVYSTAVMQHVPPDELALYLGKIASVAGEGVACANFKRMPKTTRIGPNAWAHSAADVARAVSEGAPGLAFAIDDDGAKPDEDFAKATLVMARDPAALPRWSRNPLDMSELG